MKAKGKERDLARFVCELCSATCSARSWDPTCTVERYDALTKTYMTGPRLICAACKAKLRAEAIKEAGLPPERKRPARAKDTATLPMFDEEDMLPRLRQ